MWWAYALVFLGATMVDITPFPLPPASTLMIFFQVSFGLPVWPVIILGVAGSVLGRFILTLYIPVIANMVLSDSKNKDIRFLGEKIKTGGLKAQLFILFYTLLPVSSTPLFIAAGIAKVKPYYLIPAFITGKFISDGMAVFMGDYAVANSENILNGIISLESVIALLFFLLLIFCLLFIDWRSLIQRNKLRFRFNIWK
jgi:membrane protein DedA with SNARE-associated domain